MSNEDMTRTDIEAAWHDVEFLLNSWNRLEVLQAVASAPKTRSDLRDAIDASRVTLSRILSDLDERGWIVRNGQEYRATDAGIVVATEVTELLETLQTLHQLGEHTDWMQLDAFEFELSRLRDATVITPTWDDFSALTETMLDLLEDSTHLRSIATGLDRRAATAFHDAVSERDLTIELVYTPDLITVIQDDPDLSALFHDLLTSGQVTLHRYQGESDLMMLGLYETVEGREDVVMLCGEHEEGAPPGTILASDDAVRTWAESFFRDRRSDSVELDVAAFTP